ncbi:MAG: SAM-dependent methyltransferase, partial [Paracoccaceae bacterium]
MTGRTLDTDEVAAIYDDLLETYRREWDHQGHRSMHLGLYGDGVDDPADAAMNAMRVLSEAADVSPGERVLDVGC